MGKKNKKKRKQQSNDVDGLKAETSGKNAAASASSGSSLMDSIFGSSSAVAAANTTTQSQAAASTLFSNSASLLAKRQVDKQDGGRNEMKKKKRRKDADQPRSGTSASAPLSYESTSDILERRQAQSQHSLLQSGLDFPGVFQQEGERDEIELPPEEQALEIAQAVREHGFCVMRDCIDREILDNTISPWAKKLQKKVFEALDARKIAWRITSADVETFRFKEAASRCKGRIDVAVTGGVVDTATTTTKTPFEDTAIQQRLLQNSIILPIIQNLLGDSDDSPIQLVYAGLIFNLPGSENQPWHQDGVPLFAESSNSAQIQASLPPYALNVFIPLQDSDGAIEKGPTEFLPGSHQWLAEQLGQINNNATPDDVISPILNQGDVLMYDYRVCHRGTANLSVGGSYKAIRKGTRRILYLMYARPWFTDHVNFDYTKSAETIWNTAKSTE